MDNDISHAVEERLVAIEARLDALDGGPQQEESEYEDDEETDTSNLYVPSPTTTTRRSRRSQPVEEPNVTPDNTEEGED